MTPRLARWKAALLSPRGMFLVVNIGVNLLFLLRSYVAMRVLGYAELGLVALLQTIVLLVGALQFGVVSGGYRLLCSEDEASAQRINNLVYTFIGLVGAVCAVVVCVAVLGFTESRQIAGVTVLGGVAGVLTLVRSWVSNQMLAKLMLAPLNRATLAAAVVSIGVLVFVPQAPLPACLAAIVVQPAAFVLQVLWSHKALRPIALELPVELLRRVLASGFVVFLTSILLQVNMQVERWYVVDALGLAALGHLYLSILFMGLFQIVPSSLDALFMPRLVRAHTDGQEAAVGADLRRFFLLSLGYGLLAVMLLWLLGRPVLEALLPRYVPDLRYVWLFLPGLLLFTLSSPFAIVFNVLIRYRTFMLAYGGGTLALLAVFGASAWSGRVLALEEVSLARSGAYALMALVLVAGYRRVARADRSFRFGLFGPAAHRVPS
jgi:O-antigen/teichoic acid export membrane protein